MTLRTLFIAMACGLIGFGGYQVSHLRAGEQAPPLSEVLAAAGGESGYAFLQDEQTEEDDYRISSLSVFSNVALHVKDNYVEPDRIDPREMLVAALNEIERQVAEVMVEDINEGLLRIRVMDREKIVHIDDVESLWEINLKLREVFRFLERHLPPQDDYRAIEYAAVNGALSTLDPHSVLLKPEAFAEMKTSTKGEFGGLGIVISVRDGKLTIVSPLDGTPAARAGLRARDVISRIGEVSTESMAVEEAVQMLRGPEGSKVTIWVDRKSWAETRKFVIVRERIKIQSVESELLSSNVGYIQIKNFQQNTGKDLEEHLSRLSKKSRGKLKGVVLDLRNNPGGLLEQAIRVSDRFLTSGDIVTTVGYGNKLREPKRAKWANTESDVPIAVLVNKGSASASEIVAGALKNLDRAVVIGERTFGKGSVQVLYDFADNSALKLTIAQYLTPGGISIQNEGVTPDIALTPAWLEERGVRLFYRPEGHREQNLDKHLERAGSDGPEQQPSFRMTFLVEREPEEEPSAETRPPEPEFREDYPITFARELLRDAGAARRWQILQTARSFLVERRRDQEEKIESRMKELDIDWTRAPIVLPPDKSNVEVSLSLTNHPDGLVNAGDEIELVGAIRNRGNMPLFRLHALLESEHPAFKGREFLFGRVDPGEQRTWKVKTKIPKEAAARSDIVKLAPFAGTNPLDSRATTSVVTVRVPHPQFAFQYVVDDSQRGDGDGIIEVGEGIDMHILVSNTGKGTADDVTLRLKSGAREDLFLERGRTTIGTIKPNETRAGVLRFRVPRRQSGAGKLPLELTIYDSGTNEWLEDQIDLVAKPAEPDKVRTARGGVLSKRPTVIRASSRPDSRIVAELPRGVRLPRTGRLGRMFRVTLSDGAMGWVKSADVTRVARPKRPGFARLTYRPQRRPPTIALDDNPGGKILDTEHTILSGTITGRALRDMYVLLNDQKIFFKLGPRASAPRAAKRAPRAAKRAPLDGKVKLRFSVELPLKTGLNKVLVVARLDEKVMSVRHLFITRRARPAPKVANAIRNNLPVPEPR